MGYQVIEAKRLHRTVKEKFVVYNSELIIDLDYRFSEFQKQIKFTSFSKILNEAETLFIETSSISLVPNITIFEKRILSEVKEKSKYRHSGGKGAKDNPKEWANGKDFFVRLSAYENDHRIDFVKKRLKEGSYTTTLTDYIVCVDCNDDPIDRYSLPNDDLIKFAFYIQPKTIDELQKGIVQPAFGHDGGGIEAFFEKGTSDGTFFITKPYGQD
jgi:hypothetical protein